MSMVERELALLRRSRLAALATSAWPAWLWSADGSRMLWTNAVGAAIFGAATTAECEPRRFTASDTLAAQIVRLAATLPSGSQERLERLRGFGAGFGRALTCVCSRIVLDDGIAAVLVAAAEPAGPALTLTERLRRLFTNADEAVAVFTPDGALLYANAVAQKQLAGATTLSALGIDKSAATTLGADATRALVVTLPPPPTEAPHAQAAAEPVALPPVTPSPESAAARAEPEPIAERRHPLRFVWHMDADGRFGVGSDEFIELAGPRTMATLGRLWSEIADELKLDPNSQVARALATRETWSGLVVSWPVDDSSERLPIELSGLPVFDRDRSFRGYRGFGVCRDIDRINQLARVRREGPMGFMPAPEATPQQAPVPATPPATAAPQPARTEPADAAPAAERPAASAAPASANVVPFRPSPVAEPKAPQAEPKTPPTLSPVERRAFRELAQELTSRLRTSPQEPAASESSAEDLTAKDLTGENLTAEDLAAEGLAAENPATERPEAAETAPAAEVPIERVLLDRIPIGVLVYRHDSLLYANRHFLEWTGYASLAAIEAAGGLNTLFAEAGADALAESGGSQSLSIMTRGGDKLPVEGRMFTVPWNGSSALALILTNGQNGNADADRRSSSAHALAAAEIENRELEASLDAAADGVVTLDGEGRIVTANARAAALFGKAADQLAGRMLGGLFAAASERAARDYFDRVARGSNVLNNMLDVEARLGADRLVPLAMTLTRIGGDRFAALFRDATACRQSEEELRNAKREAMRTSSAKAEFLAKVSHEIRTPLNSMTGFAEVIMAERFGPIGNERYREYVKDIHGAGTHLVSLLNDLLDLSRIETGQTELNFANLNLNDITQQCVGIMQPQANRARIIIRTSLTPNLPHVVADERSLRQIVLNLISNSIRFTGPGGQVIVSTVFSDAREAVLRVRDTGVGMSKKDIAAALEPFRETATSGSWGSGGTGFGLPLTKALAEANRANFGIKSAPNAGTLIEIAFPPNRVVAD